MENEIVGMTITEKILARHAALDSVKSGDFVICEVDLALANDITAPLAIAAFEQAGAQEVFDRDKIALIPDHFTPNRDIRSAEQSKVLREFARQHRITHYYEIGRMGVEHALLPELGLVRPGGLIIGADSHTCTHGALGAMATGVGSTDLGAVMITGKIWLRIPETMKFSFSGTPRPWVGAKDYILHLIHLIGVNGANYKVMEFTGEAVENLSVEERLTMCNMAVEAGAKSGIVPPDSVTYEYLSSIGVKECEMIAPDRDARYHSVMEIDVSGLEPQVAFPHLPSNTHPVSQAKGISVDQVFIGSCTNGRISDMRQAAAVMKGRTVHHMTRMIVIPATQSVYKQALKEGLIDIFIEAGAAVSTPTCGPCLGGHMGILAAGERAVATSNRNFIGRMGHPQSEVYLANPAVAAASAVAGHISSPEDI